ncbi:hypothetical protein CRV24_000704 [Beauveria bassiana]|nr:hypothetical protein CRV24_000704 [Beauveria bassiana]
MDSSSAPLAHYFWIAGVESISYDDAPQTILPVDDTIAEDGEPDNGVIVNGQHRANAARHSRQNSANRLSKLSIDAHSTISTVDDDGSRSNRSSATIRPSSKLPPSANGSSTVAPLEEGLPLTVRMGDVDFDRALLKFAAERENFLEDLSFTAGARVQARAPMVNPRAERIKADEIPSGRMSPLRSLKGSIRRKISFREMSSTKRQGNINKSSSINGAASVRTAKRLSNYNSVIPPPEPLNTDPDMHPLKRRFEPVLLDRYPPRLPPKRLHDEVDSQIMCPYRLLG